MRAYCRCVFVWKKILVLLSGNGIAHTLRNTPHPQTTNMWSGIGSYWLSPALIGTTLGVLHGHLHHCTGLWRVPAVLVRLGRWPVRRAQSRGEEAPDYVFQCLLSVLVRGCVGVRQCVGVRGGQHWMELGVWDLHRRIGRRQLCARVGQSPIPASPTGWQSVGSCCTGARRGREEVASGCSRGRRIVAWGRLHGCCSNFTCARQPQDHTNSWLHVSFWILVRSSVFENLFVHETPLCQHQVS